ncbi:hypothetical protein D9619_008627 [Psilocybe cf. subviscida]|uniref:NACHT domain-containing protein n=1 Tax=Psilocybe cf. subviscida TaxID=2480587 RepID=A0A8H5F0W0_9AGAR|nr:hypothetical protein D9619_008627 [Psilocybe cf. subviscida]
MLPIVPHLPTGSKLNIRWEDMSYIVGDKGKYQASVSNPTVYLRNCDSLQYPNSREPSVVEKYILEAFSWRSLIFHFSNPRILNMKGDQVENGHERDMVGLQLLRRKSAQGAAHDSVNRFPPVRCHPATRRSVVGDALRWFHQRPSAKSGMLWLQGAAGAGKTALAQTICECLVRTRHLGASFFFSRTAHDRGRDDPSYLFTTIAHQLSLALPHLAPYIEDAILRDPAVVDKTPAIQFLKLVLEPLCRLSESERRPMAIVVDGLDECPDENAQVQLIESIGYSMNEGTHQVSFIITSRPSPRICSVFARAPLSDQTYTVSLAQSMDTDRDIRAYLSSRFMDIREDPRHRSAMASVPPTWPGEDVISHLVETSSALFLYAATVVKFIDDPGSRPAERLSLITSLLSASATHPKANLDTLYSCVLSLAPDSQRMVNILGTIIAMRDNARRLQLTWGPGRDTLSIAENLLDMQEDDGYMALRSIHSLVVVNEPAIGSKDEQDEAEDDPMEYAARGHTEAVRFYHRSFVEFLRDRSRAGEYFIDMIKLNARLAIGCLRRLETLSLLPRSRINDVTWGYSLLHWTAHVTASDPSDKVLLQALQDFDILGCYIAAHANEGTNSGVVIDMKRLVISPKTLLRSLQSRLWSGHTPRPAICPKSLDITRARDTMLRTCARRDMEECGHKRRLEDLLAWLQVAYHPFFWV